MRFLRHFIIDIACFFFHLTIAYEAIIYHRMKYIVIILQVLKFFFHFQTNIFLIIFTSTTLLNYLSVLDSFKNMIKNK